MRHNDVPGVSPFVLALRDLSRDQERRALGQFEIGGLTVEVRASRDSIWAIPRRAGKGGLALRAAYIPTEFRCERLEAEPGEAMRLGVTSSLGEHRIVFGTDGRALEHLRVTVSLTPAVPMLVPFMPRDLYPLDTHDDPIGARGNVEAAQRGLNGGVLYLRIDEPAFGNVLYFQNLTAMNDYYRATKTKPDGAVGGEWPELGYLIPTPPQSGTPPTDPLEPGVTITLSDAILVVRPNVPRHERETARHFLQMLGATYKKLAPPRADYRDWMGRAERTLHDLAHAPEATIRHYGNLYIHPYTASEYPDIMVQMSLVAAIHDWGKWHGKPHPLEKRLKRGLNKFHDPKIKSLRRYLPNVGDDKNADAMDSWYLYHPLLNLGRLALDGDEEARALFLKSIDHGIEAARHFQYKWPIQYDIRDFSVITAVAPADGKGQTDVGGFYAWVMLQAYALTEDERFLHEARAAIDAAVGMRFNLNYQANLTAWGAAACMRLWRITNQSVYLEQSYVYLASFFHNCELWESEIGHAVHYRTFMGVTALQDAPYTSLFECFDSFSAFEHYLHESGPDLEPEVRMLVAEYCRHTLHRAWFYYPDTLPKEILATDIRNGHIDQKLSFPLEDLYPDGQPAGQVGQEIYGAGAAFIFATRAFHHVEGAPFRLYCDHFIRTRERMSATALSLTLHGGEACTALLGLVRLKRGRLPTVTLRTGDGDDDVIKPCFRSEDRIDFHIPANGRVILSWEG